MIRTTTPPTPRMPGRLERRLYGLLHAALSKFSEWYCAWLGIAWDANIRQLPFGLLIKSTGRCGLSEYAAMKMARAAGMPAPRALSCGDHPNDELRRVSILMTRLPGEEMINSRQPLDLDSEEPWVFELKDCVEALRKWRSPYSISICSPLGTSISSLRVPRHEMGPFQSEQELHDYLLSTASSHAHPSAAAFEKDMEKAHEIRATRHRNVFTHGDLWPHNVLVGEDGHLKGILDWETAGWLPEYWEFTTIMKRCSGTWWYQVATWMGGDRYEHELQCEKAIHRLTVDSWIGM